MIRHAVLACVFCCCLAAQGGDAKKEAELKWAKGVLSDFLQSARSRDYDQMEILMTKELRQAMEKYESFVGKGTKGWSLTKDIPGESWAIKSEEISPDIDEIVLKGHFKREKEESEFSTRLVKEKDSGKWRITYIYSSEWKSMKTPSKM